MSHMATFKHDMSNPKVLARANKLQPRHPDIELGYLYILVALRMAVKEQRQGSDYYDRVVASRNPDGTLTCKIITCRRPLREFKK
jgi:hypothetical protein